MELNNFEHFFDAGDCCLEYPECTNTIQGDSNLWFTRGPHYEIHEVVCPEHVCIKSDIYCIQELMGDGICHDNNNSKLCDWDFGDCCGVIQNVDVCCICACLPSIEVVEFPHIGIHLHT